MPQHFTGETSKSRIDQSQNQPKISYVNIFSMLPNFPSKLYYLTQDTEYIKPE